MQAHSQPTPANLKLKIINYLRTIVEPAPLPKNKERVQPDTHIENTLKTNVRPPSQPKKQRAVTTPIYCPNKAKNTLIEVWDGYDADLLACLYSDYKRAITDQIIAPTKRHGRKWLHRRIVAKHQSDINAQTTDAILVLFNIYLERHGVLQLNPDYTGNPPYPRYVRNEL
jgi:hypothetical protein